MVDPASQDNQPQQPDEDHEDFFDLVELAKKLGATEFTEVDELGNMLAHTSAPTATIDPEIEAKKLALTQKVTEYTEHFQIVSAVLAGYQLHRQRNTTSHRYNDLQKLAKTLTTIVTAPQGYGQPYYGSRADIERVLKPHQHDLLAWLNRAVNSYEEVRKTNMQRSGMSLKEMSMYPSVYRDVDAQPTFIIPETIVDAVTRLQKDVHEKVSQELTSITSYIEKRRGYLNAELDHFPSVLDSVLESTIAKMKEAVANSLTPEVDTNGDKEQTQQTQAISASDLPPEQQLSFQQAQTRFKGIHENFCRTLSSIYGFRFLTNEQYNILEKLDNLASPIWHSSYGAVSVEPESEVEDSRHYQKYVSESYEGFKLEIAPENPIEATPEVLLDMIVDAAFALNELARNGDHKYIFKNFLSTWLKEPNATEHIEFMFTKLFDDPEFLTQYPNVIGSGVVKAPNDRLLTKEDFPPKWIEPRPHHCGADTASFIYQRYGWGVGVSTYFDSVMD